MQHISNKNKLLNIPMNPEFITVHSTGNEKSTAQNERDNLNRADNVTSTGFHIVIDDKHAIECLPLNRVAYHAGDGAIGIGNTKSIGVEICESGDRNKTLQNAVELISRLLFERNWGVDKLKRHYDWSGKNCPRIMSANNWADWNKFKFEVENELDKLNKPVEVVKDNEVSDWAIEAREWAIKNNITDGNRPKDIATREEIWTMLYRSKGVK